MSFNEQFDEADAGRQEFADRLKLLTKWMDKKGLLNVPVQEQLQRLGAQVHAAKIKVAFAGDSSSGKSELINAILFAHYGRKIMPSGPGCTAMCLTELGYELGLAPSLRLLPIETRLVPQALMEWRLTPAKWQQIDLVVDDASQLAASFKKLTEVQHVSIEYARALGFWNDGSPENNPPVARDGQVEIPKWRCALINIAHPLLKQGLVVLDLPGLNAIGAESDLKVSLIAQADAVVLTLSTDFGITRSDLTTWHEQLSSGEKSGKSRQTQLVVLNKIDTWWDDLGPAGQKKAQIDQQKVEVASLLDLPQSQIIAISAKKGLLAKITRDDVLLQASQLPAFERLLGQFLMAKRTEVTRATLVANIGGLRTEAGRILYVRHRDLVGQILELRGLEHENSAVVSHMRQRTAQEQAELSGSSARLNAVRSVHQALLAKSVGLLDVPALKADLVELLETLKQPGIKLGLKKSYGQAFSRLRQRLQDGQALAGEIQTMLDSAFRQVNAEFGFSLRVEPAPDLTRYLHDLDLVELSHLQYFGLANVIRLAQPDFSDRLVRALGGRLRRVFESALGEINLWNKSASAQLDTQVRERSQNFDRRMKALERIEQAVLDLDKRITELDDLKTIQKAVEAKFAGLTSRLLDFEPVVVSANQSFHDPIVFAPAATLV